MTSTMKANLATAVAIPRAPHRKNKSADLSGQSNVHVATHGVEQRDNLPESRMRKNAAAAEQSRPIAHEHDQRRRRRSSTHHHNHHDHQRQHHENLSQHRNHESHAQRANPPPSNHDASRLSSTNATHGANVASKSTAHVPCKFFRVGQCQAGKACPFAHTLDSSTDEICKYFQRGNCKFGQKCALAHVLPNGRRVNRPQGQSKMPQEHARMNDQQYARFDDSLATLANMPAFPFDQHSQPADFAHQPQSLSHQPVYINQRHHGLGEAPPFAMTGIENKEDGGGGENGLEFGGDFIVSDPDANLMAKSLSLSPPRLDPHEYHGPLNAPLPASFDSQGISYIARHGPVAASMPSRSGMAEKMSPLMKTKATRRQIFHKNEERSSNSPFHREAPLFASRVPREELHDGGKFHHVMGGNMFSASLPRVSHQSNRITGPIEWEEDDGDDEFVNFYDEDETDFIPADLHDQILTSQEKLRRLSRHDNSSISGRDGREGITSGNAPGGSLMGSSPVDSITSRLASSPFTTSSGSPSRFEAFFHSKRQIRPADPPTASNLSLSPFCHVGSPLRNLQLADKPVTKSTPQGAMIQSIKPLGDNSDHTQASDILDLAGSSSLPPLQSSISAQLPPAKTRSHMSTLSQQLSEAKLSSHAHVLSNQISDSRNANVDANAHASIGGISRMTNDSKQQTESNRKSSPQSPPAVTMPEPPPFAQQYLANGLKSKRSNMSIGAFRIMSQEPWHQQNQQNQQRAYGNTDDVFAMDEEEGDNISTRQPQRYPRKDSHDMDHQREKDNAKDKQNRPLDSTTDHNRATAGAGRRASFFETARTDNIWSTSVPRDTVWT